MDANCWCNALICNGFSSSEKHPCPHLCPLFLSAGSKKPPPHRHRHAAPAVYALAALAFSSRAVALDACQEGRAGALRAPAKDESRLPWHSPLTVPRAPAVRSGNAGHGSAQSGALWHAVARLPAATGARASGARWRPKGRHAPCAVTAAPCHPWRPWQSLRRALVPHRLPVRPGNPPTPAAWRGVAAGIACGCRRARSH